MWIAFAGLFAGGMASVLYIQLTGATGLDIEGLGADDGHVLLDAPGSINTFELNDDDPVGDVAPANHLPQFRFETSTDNPVDARLPPPALNPVALIGNPATEYEHVLIEQPIDPHWAPRMESRIYESIADSELQIAAMQVHCRTSLRRIEVILNAAQTPDDALGLLAEFTDPVMDAISGGGWRVNGLTTRVVGDRVPENMPGLGSQGRLQSLISYVHDSEPRRLSPKEREEWLQSMSPEQRRSYLENLERHREELLGEIARRSEFESVARQ